VVLVVDEISAKTLPALDALYNAGSDESKTKLTNIIMKTEGKPLRRLLLASIARQKVLGFANDPRLSPEERFLEKLIQTNIFSIHNPRFEDEINEVLDIMDDGVSRILLSGSIARYNFFLENGTD